LTPRILFQLVLKLVSGKNREGFEHALTHVFEGLKLAAPTKGALSQMRSRVSYRFFRDAFTKLSDQAQPHCRTFRGYRIYAHDGLELVLPRTKDVLENGFIGRAVGQYRETHYPRMYVLHCYDVLSEVTKAVEFSNQNEELTMAENIIPNLEQKSISLYDAAFPSRRLIIAHRDAKNFFVARMSTASFADGVRLLDLKIKRRTAVIEGVKVRFIKIKNPRTGEYMLFMTNLPKYWVDDKTINSLYGLRWEVENSFRDWVDTHKIEQWHSKKTNGILQEFFASLWLINYARIQTLFEFDPILKDPLDPHYEKPNFKLILDTVIRRLHELFIYGPKNLANTVRELINRTTVKRKRRSRSYKRVLRGSPSSFNYDNQVWNPQVTGVVN
jgi:hypothetical protein